MIVVDHCGVNPGTLPGLRTTSSYSYINAGVTTLCQRACPMVNNRRCDAPVGERIAAKITLVSRMTR